MSGLSPGYLMVAIIFFLLGLLFCSIIKQAERHTFYINNEKKRYKKEGKLLYFVVFILLILFVLLNKPTGDLPVYLEVFHGMKQFEVEFLSINGLYTNEMEPMFQLWCYVIRSMTDNEKVFLFITYGYIWASVLWFISKYTNKTLYMIPFLMMWPVMINFTSGLRYGLAIGHCLIALIALKDKKYIMALLFAFLAIFTHFLALALLFYLGAYYGSKLLFKRVNSVKTILILAIAIAAFAGVGLGVFQTFRFSYRMTDEVETNSVISYFPYVIFSLIILFLNKNKKGYNTPNEDLCTFAIHLNMVMIPITVLWGIYRLPYLFMLPMVVALSNTFGNGIKDKKTIRLFVTIVIVFFSFIKIITMGAQSGALDYSFDF